MLYLITKCPYNAEGPTKRIDWTKSADGCSVTKRIKGFKHIELLVEKDGETICV